MTSPDQLPPDSPLLPRRASEERPLFIILTAMAFLAGLTLLLFFVGLRASQSWQSDLESKLTVQVFYDQTDDITDITRRASDIVQTSVPGSRIKIMSSAEARDLLTPWIGNLDLPDDMPLPIMINVTRIGNAAVDAQAMEEALSRAGIESDIDDHTRWGKDIKRTWRAVQIGMAAIIMIVLGASAAVTAYATQSVLRIRQTIIDVLAHVGAPDHYIVSLFTKRFFGLGIRAGIVGGVSALLFLIIFASAAKSYAVNVLPVTGLRLGDFVWLIILMLVFGLISAGTAGITTLAKLNLDRRSA